MIVGREKRIALLQFDYYLSFGDYNWKVRVIRVKIFIYSRWMIQRLSRNQDDPHMGPETANTKRVKHVLNTSTENYLPLVTLIHSLA